MTLLVECPHCGGVVEVAQINCAIFRHGWFKDSNRQINPHESREECNRLASEGLILGCGKPFRVVMNSDRKWVAEICEYV